MYNRFFKSACQYFEFNIFEVFPQKAYNFKKISEMRMMKTLGSKGEDIAADFLKKKGYKIIRRNYKTPLGEADIIVKDNNTIVFVEVKARTSDAFGQPFEAVNYRKQEKFKKIALYYLKHNKIELSVRFDVVSILSKDGKAEVNHIMEAF
ncbi:MAG: YraN family protein [Nitrospirae bacterium]|nr:YraN family protein [Nitrospirota bacterium]MCL5977594.1 YraN family protein [Nitrospirota bacterium]